ncbi:MAG TPA: S8 family peptidase, partial [Gemmatimonadaceae bacterium]|nr:S8 family peptidase [Gemmatimonadaceae bacterium]
MKKAGLLAFVALGFAACQDSPTAARTPSDAPDAPELVSNHYIVVLADGSGPQLSASLAARAGVKVTHSYGAALKGFAGEMSAAVAAELARDPRVKYVEQDQVMRASTTQTGATWGIDRIDQRARPTDGSYTYNSTGAGVTAYIIDTGILFSHSEFGGRAVTGVDEVTAGGNAQDCNGHGTHVSGTVGGATYGVAKGVSLVAVRVLDCGGSGSTSGVIAGVNWVAANHASPAVANMSLGGGASTALDDAVRGAIASGVTFGVAAGNGNFIGIAQDACKYSPARVAEAITVGATTNTDAKTSWSNYGNCVDLFAPGNNITSSWYTSNTATNTISGTSMATPHVVGVAAQYLAANPTATPQHVRDAIVGNATQGIVTSSKTVNNHL